MFSLLLRRGLTTLSNPSLPPTVKRRSLLLRSLVGLGGFGAASYACVAVNIANPTLLPLPLANFAVGVEGAGRFFKTAYYIAPAVLEWVYIEKWLAGRIPAQELEEQRSSAHARTAQALLSLIRNQGGIFIKSGQHMCASPVVPKVYVDTLKVLMDNAISRDLKETEKTWREEFGTELREYFKDFNPTPIATASLAQVYTATLPDGSPVAIKVQHRDVARLFNVDLEIGSFYYATLAKIFPNLDFTFMMDELKRAFGEELDFNLEAKNGKRARQLFHKVDSAVIVPEVIDQFSSKRVLTMQFEEGIRIDDREGLKRLKIDPAAPATELISLFSKMMFIHGFVHCDPHPGNILVRPAKNKVGCELILLDHGTYQHLSEEVMYNYAKIWKSVIMADFKELEEATARFGIDRKFSKFVGFVLTFSAPTKDPLIADDPFSPEEIQEIVSDFVDLEDYSKSHEQMAEYSKVFELLPRSLLLILKTNNLIRFVNEQLGSPVNRFSIMGRFCLQGINRVDQRHSKGLWVKVKGFYEIARLQLFVRLYPLLQWAFMNLYARVALPGMSKVLDRKRKEGKDYSLI